MFYRVLFASLFLVSPAFADNKYDLTGRDFIMPSRNVSCVKLDPENGLSDRLYCLRLEPEPIVVVLDKTGAHAGTAEGDQPFLEDPPVLQYGKTWYHEGFTCDSSTTGLVCSHREYGGFELARKGFKRLR